MERGPDPAAREEKDMTSEDQDHRHDDAAAKVDEQVVEQIRRMLANPSRTRR